MTAGKCSQTHDLTSTILSTLICIGLVLSYCPQFVRIIRARTSEGFSPWFLLLGATSSTSAMLNMWILQWAVVKCCRLVSYGTCFEKTLGLSQVFLQWGLFSFLFILYIYYFPSNSKYYSIIASNQGSVIQTETTPLIPSGHDETDEPRVRPPRIATPEWRLAIALGIFVAAHLAVLTVFTVGFISRLDYGPNGEPHPLLHSYAEFLGVASMLLTLCQYAPQIIRTYRSKMVGALSIEMMLIQVPGSAIFVGSLINREGVEWSAWISYAIAGSMQLVLLIMCVLWKIRQRRLGHDDFGKPLQRGETHAEDEGSDVGVGE